jgi:hypothetical protein
MLCNRNGLFFQQDNQEVTVQSERMHPSLDSSRMNFRTKNLFERRMFQRFYTVADVPLTRNHFKLLCSVQGNTVFRGGIDFKMQSLDVQMVEPFRTCCCIAFQDDVFESDRDDTQRMRG